MILQNKFLCGDNLMARTTLFAGDENFKHAPRPFVQMYVICCKDNNGNHRPYMYFFIPTKNKDMYMLVLKCVKKFIGHIPKYHIYE